MEFIEIIDQFFKKYPDAIRIKINHHDTTEKFKYDLQYQTHDSDLNSVELDPKSILPVNFRHEQFIAMYNTGIYSLRKIISFDNNSSFTIVGYFFNVYSFDKYHVCLEGGRYFSDKTKNFKIYDIYRKSSDIFLNYVVKRITETI